MANNQSIGHFNLKIFYRPVIYILIMNICMFTEDNKERKNKMKSIAHSRKTTMNRSNVKKKKRNVEHHHGLREK